MPPRTLLLFGDSILDNDVYVPDGPGVAAQVRRALGSEWSVTKHAVDGDVTTDVPGQVERAGRGATHAVLSIGGNDLFRNKKLLDGLSSPKELEQALGSLLPTFEAQYDVAVRAVSAASDRVAVCTIYNAIPFVDERMAAMAPPAIGIVNSAIRRIAAERNLRVLPLDETLLAREDYSTISPIEPSEAGGEKIAAMIADFCQGEARA